MLNEAQQRCLSVALRLLEDNLLIIEKQLEASDYIGMLKEVKNDISFSIQDAIREKASRIREGIKIISERFHLPKTCISTSTIALSSISYCWQILEDTTSKKLKKFGRTPEDLGTSLDPPMNEMLDRLLEIEFLLRK